DACGLRAVVELLLRQVAELAVAARTGAPAAALDALAQRCQQIGRGLFLDVRRRVHLFALPLRADDGAQLVPVGVIVLLRFPIGRERLDQPLRHLQLLGRDART